MLRAASSLIGVLLAAGAAWGQPALLTNAQVEVVAAGPLPATVEARVRAATTARWIGYEVPMVDGDRFACDWSGSSTRPAPTSVKLEGPDTLYVLIRAEQAAVSRIRVFSEGCAIDAGGLPLTWLTGARPADSVALLAGLLTAGPPRRVADGALSALALHREPAAVTALLAAARSGPTAAVRGQALFWVAQRAGDRAVPAIREAIDTDPDTDVKKKAVFALSQLPNQEGVPRLIDVAERHSNPAVRRQAMFWLGQSRDPRALAFFERVLLK